MVMMMMVVARTTTVMIAARAARAAGLARGDTFFQSLDLEFPALFHGRTSENEG
jgi:hypothetical protein